MNKKNCIIEEKLSLKESFHHNNIYLPFDNNPLVQLLVKITILI